MNAVAFVPVGLLIYMVIFGRQDQDALGPILLFVAAMFVFHIAACTVTKEVGWNGVLFWLCIAPGTFAPLHALTVGRAVDPLAIYTYSAWLITQILILLVLNLKAVRIQKLEAQNVLNVNNN